MGSKGRRSLVVDASVARAAGTREHPTSVTCRDFLRAMLDICHRVAADAELRREWRKHRSQFFLIWLSEMEARGKFVVVDSTDRRVEIEDAVVESKESPKDQEAILKDVHLVATALATDGLVVSLDDACRGLFDEAAESVAALRRIAWINPLRELDGGIGWLKAGAKCEKGRRLGATSR